MTKKRLIKEECSIEDLLKTFQSNLIKSDYSQSTGAVYKSDIVSILHEIQFSLDTIIKTQQDCQNLVEAIKQGMEAISQSGLYQQSSLNRKGMSANAFLTFLKKIAEVKVDIFYKTKPVEWTIIRTLTTNQFEKLMEHIPTHGTFMNTRDRAIFSMIFYIGEDLGEIIRIEYDDFTREDGKITTFKVRTKYRILNMPLPDNVVKELENYEIMYKAANKEPPLNFKEISYFRNKSGRPISTRSIRRNLENYANKAGLKYVSPISLRQSYMERQLTSGVTVVELAKLMGVTPSYIKSIQQRLPYFIAKQNQNL